MPKKNGPPPAVVARSHLMALAERVAQEGASKAVVVFMNDHNHIGYAITEETSMPEAIFMMRQAEFMIFESPNDSEDEYEEMM